jgi:hypothetical protein
MRLSRQITQFGHVVSALGGEARITYAKDAKNVRLDGFKLAPRYGFANVAVKPGSSSDTFECFGLGVVTNTSGTTEGLSVENRAGVCNLYSVNVSTFARTAITATTVPASKASVVGYNDNSYIIFPGQAKSVWKHAIGNASSLSAVADTAYSAPPTDAQLTATSQDYGTRWNLDPGDTVTYTSTNGITTVTDTVTNGILTVSGADNDNGVQHRTLTQIVFATTQDWSSRGYIGVEVLAGNIFSSFEVTNTIPQVQTGGVWRDCEFKEFVESGKVLITVRIKGVTGINAVQGIRFTIGGSVNRIGTSTAYIVNPLKLGGQYLEATSGTDRIWTYANTGTGINYAVRYCQAAGAAPRSTANQKSIPAAGAQGSSLADYDTRLGGRTALSVVAANTGTYTHVQFLRLMEDGVTWKELAVVLNTAGTSPSTIDTYEENELSGLTTVTLTGVTVSPTPTFSTEGVANAFPYKESMVWLFSKGTGNIQISRMGDPEEIYSDEAAANGDYSTTDNTNPARRTMADNAADVPVWGSQIGQIAVVLGSKSAYSFSGDYPEQTTPCREIPGSRGVAGIDAATRYRPVQGQYAVAYADDDLNIWSIGGTPQFVDDASVRPFELSEPVRKKLKAFLLDAQKPEFPSLTVSSVQLEFDDVTSSLWVVLGRRAAVLRQGTGNDGWDLHEYQLTVPPGSATVSTCTAFYTNSAVATSVAPGDAAWSNNGFAFVSDDSYCTSASLGFGTLRTTETLRCDGFTPATPIPVSATITGLTYRAEFSKTGDLAVTNVDAQPRVAGASSGTDRSTGTTLTSTDVVQDYVPSANPTVAQINAGSVGFDLKFEQETWLAAWNDPLNWTITVSGGGTAASMTVTATYIGGGTVPTRVYVDVTSAATAVFDPLDMSQSIMATATVTADNGLGATNSGTINYDSSSALDETLVDSSTERKVISLTAGTGTTVITRSATGTVTIGTGWQIAGTYTGSAALSVPTAATVRVDNVALRVCYDVTTASSGATTGISIQKSAFVDGLNLGIRNSGQIDVFERYNGTDVSGAGRDGGYSMPDAFFETQDMSFEGAYAQVAQVQVHTDTLADSVTVAFKSDETAYTNGTSIVKARWKRFELSMKGIRFNGKLTFGEGAENISGLTIEYNKKSRGIN